MAAHGIRKCVFVLLKVAFVVISTLFLLYSTESYDIYSTVVLKTTRHPGDTAFTKGVIDTVYVSASSLDDKVLVFNEYIINKAGPHIRLCLEGDLMYKSNLNISKTKTNYTVKRGFVDGFYSYRTSVKNTFTFILSWKSAESDARSHTELLGKVLPVSQFYTCVRGESVARLAGWAAFANGMSKIMCQRNCSDNPTDLVNTMPSKEYGALLDVSYESMSYDSSCSVDKKMDESLRAINQMGLFTDKSQINSQPFSRMKKMKKTFEENQESNSDILTAVDVVVGGCLISKESLIFTSQKEILVVNGCAAKMEEGIKYYIEKSRTVSLVNNMLVFKDEPDNIEIPEYNEIFTIEQGPNNENYYHLLAEKITKLSLFVPLLRTNHQIAIHTVPKSEYYVYQFLKMFGLKNKIVSGDVKTKVAYVPHSGMCHQPVIAGLQQSQAVFRTFIKETIWRDNSTIPRDTIVYIKRRKRQLHQEKDIIASLETYGKLLNLKVFIFDDARLPSLEDTMLLFHRAVLVIGPHRAGLANILFCQPGTVVVEVQCGGYWSRPCFRNTAFKLGLRYYATVFSTDKDHIQRDRCNKKGVTFDTKELSVLLKVIFGDILNDLV